MVAQKTKRKTSKKQVKAVTNNYCNQE